MILTTDTQLHEMERTVDTARESSETVKVPKAALRALLLDHTTLWTALRERKLLQITVNKDQESLR